MITKLKKNPKAYVELQQEFYKNIEEKNLSSKLCHYVWDILISMNRGYGQLRPFKSKVAEALKL